jgi:hypothetical protein
LSFEQHSREEAERNEVVQPLLANVCHSRLHVLYSHSSPMSAIVLLLLLLLFRKCFAGATAVCKKPNKNCWM